jgi:hypothetical protein
LTITPFCTDDWPNTQTKCWIHIKKIAFEGIFLLST